MYELKVLEHFIQIVLNPLTLKPEIFNEKYLIENARIIASEKIKICNHFRLKAFSERKQKTLDIYYRSHQVLLVQLADQAYIYLTPERPESIYKLTNDESILNLYKDIMRIPEDLLDYIEQNFPEYFDKSYKVPEAKWRKQIPEIKRELSGIKKGLVKQHIYEGLIKIVTDAFEHFILPGQVISYQEISYIQKFQASLICFIKKNSVQNPEEMLCLLLMQLNFNSIRFFNYFIERLQERSRLWSSLPDKIEFFSQQLKIINQLPVEPGPAFKPELPAAREQTGGWICEELAFLEKKQRLNLLPVAMGESALNETTKVQTSLSVAQLALAVKLLIEAKVITNKNAAELMRMVAGSFKTDRQELISEESLRNKSYSFETSTVNRLKDVVIELLNLVRRY